MHDDRVRKLAEILLDHSIAVQKGDRINIRVTTSLGMPLAREVYKGVVQRGAFPHLETGDDTLAAYYLKHASKDQLSAKPVIAEAVANWADKSVTIVADQNTRELASVPPENSIIRAKILKPIRDISIKKPWILVYYPTPAMAQDAGMNLEEFEDFFFKACVRDWKKEQSALERIAEYFNKVSEIQVIGEHTNLKMSVKNRVWIPCYGTYNMPDGEVFTAPVEDTVAGHVYFEYPLIRNGKTMRDIQLWFEKGKIVRTSASENHALLESILDTDAGARFLGEFAIGTNKMIQQYMYNTLFDEKMAGTIHMAVGQAYEECKGVNSSTVHMDIVKNMRSDGAKIIADGITIYENGQFIGPLQQSPNK